MEVYEKDASAGPVFCDFEEIHNALEATLASQRPGDVREYDWTYRSDNDAALTHAIATADFDVTALPNPNSASNLASADSVAKQFGEDHATPFNTVGAAKSAIKKGRHAPALSGT
jgi:hypothetical protein